ncbi:Tannase/feruloyl esterase [Dactylonectria macrodidyma]|uniref:Carboxylic ester hydrolase n=1 Tax=Dactylonectria macrodidyma TaxID=307937 RepID=A0A9P9E521_9HYPO|nr:Tannase/feruloyl esterase [Dactylonectria macrodidyma]
MALSCSTDTLAVPQLFGGKILSFEANLVEKYNATAYSQLYYGHSTVTAKNLDFCNVTVTYTHPGQNDTINVETWLPIDNYNGRLHAVGGGGWIAGRYSPSYTAMSGAVSEGYATSTTDAGLYEQADMKPDSWALTSEGNPNLYLLNNFGSVSLEDQAIITKALISSFYGQAPRYSYWSGCSQGGRQGMMLAQRYPEAYDGIHACAPAIFWTQLLSTTFWPQLMMIVMDYYPLPCELNAIVMAAVDACDELDGIVDGIISNDEACTFDPLSVVGTSFTCSDTGSNMTISTEAAKLAKMTWAGPRSEAGKFMWYGPNVGSQLTGSTSTLTNDIGLAMTSCSSDGKCVGVPVGLGEVWIKYWVEANPDWSYENMTRAEFEHYVHASIQRFDSLIATNDADLTDYYKRGGKILGYHGMNDQIIPVKSTEHYYNMVKEFIPAADQFYRMFEVPGLLHCSGGPGGQPSNTFDALRAWVENGTVPESLPHSYTDDDGKEQNRLLCPYPKKSKIIHGARAVNGTYQSDDFVCI